jgi:hypothetical protein
MTVDSVIQNLCQQSKFVRGNAFRVTNENARALSGLNRVAAGAHAATVDAMSNTCILRYFGTCPEIIRFHEGAILPRQRIEFAGLFQEGRGSIETYRFSGTEIAQGNRLAAIIAADLRDRLAGEPYLRQCLVHDGIEAGILGCGKAG